MKKLSMRGNLTIALALAAILISILMWQLTVAYGHALNNHQDFMDEKAQNHLLELKIEQMETLIQEQQNEINE